MRVIAEHSKAGTQCIRKLFDSGDLSRPVRLVAMELDGAWPKEVQACLAFEGLEFDGAVVTGRWEYFRSALLRWPQGHLGLGRMLAERLDLSVRPAQPLTLGTGRLLTGRRTVVMGVLNVTPDSFFDGGRYDDPETARARARQMVVEGADMIDVGGESTRPNAEPVPLDVELNRILPVIRGLSGHVEIPISVDTYKSKVAEEALKAGASVVNDITGLRHDPDMARVAADHGAVVIVMHIKGNPRTMQASPVYDDVVREVREYLEIGCERAIRAGVPESRIWVDPGIGFGKSVGHNLELLRNLRSFRSMGFPILVGTSNKSVIGRILGLPVTERGEGTAATVSMAIAEGADGVRVHDVRAMRRVCDMTDAIVRGSNEVSS